MLSEGTLNLEVVLFRLLLELVWSDLACWCQVRLPDWWFDAGPCWSGLQPEDTTLSFFPTCGPNSYMYKGETAFLFNIGSSCEAIFTTLHTKYLINLFNPVNLHTSLLIILLDAVRH